MMWGWQEYIVALILLVCVILITRQVYVFFRTAKKKENPCASCVSGCDLKRQLDKKRSECSSKPDKTIKKCH